MEPKNAPIMPVTFISARTQLADPASANPSSSMALAPYPIGVPTMVPLHRSVTLNAGLAEKLLGHPIDLKL